MRTLWSAAWVWTCAAALALLQASAGAQAVECAGQLSLSGAAGTLSEESRFGEVKEEAFWPGVGVSMAQPLQKAGLCLGLDAWARGGSQGVYEGFTQVGAKHKTDVTHTNFGTGFFLRGALGERFEWQALAGLERFDRAIEPKGTTGGITEQYTWYWLGAGGTWHACPSCRYPVSLRVTREHLQDGKSAVNLFAFGNAVIDFDQGRKTGIDVIVQPPADSKHLPVMTLYWQKRSFDGTGNFPVPGQSYSVRQPQFNVQDLGLQLSFPLK